MKINDKTALISEAISRVVNNAPVSEILRVYSLALQAELDKMDDEKLVNSLETAGYLDLLKKYTDMENAQEGK